jgi:CheY-like chemotaxis protein
MGSEITVVSSPGKGSTFSFTLLLARAAKNLALRSSGENGRTSAEIEALLSARRNTVRILVAEDDWVNQEVILELLREVIGFNVDIAQNGESAVDLVQKNNYNLILMDMQMPQMDGLEATRCIRQIPELKALPIIAMTANAFAEDEADCMEAGMSDFITKPVDPNILFATMLKWLERSDIEATPSS